MQHDEVIWQIINTTHCRYRLKTTEKIKFCRNSYNLTGKCCRSMCPLANSQYATVREENGVCYLYMKTVERAAFPDRLWEKIKLSRDFDVAIQQINENLLYWNVLIRNKCKMRLMKIMQYLLRMRHLRLTRRRKIVVVRKKVERREKRREEKALVAARIDNAIEQELLERLKKGTYGELYQFPETAFKTALEEQEIESDVEFVEEEEELERDDPDVGKVQYVAADDFKESDVSDIEDMGSDDSDMSSDDAEKKKPVSKKLKRGKIEVEYEAEPSTSVKAKRTTF